VADKRWHRWLRRSSYALMAIAVIILGYVGVLIGYQSYEQRKLSSEWDQATNGGQVADITFTSATTPVVRPHLADGKPMAKLVMAKVGFSAIVTEGSQTGVLTSGPGHDEHTKYPGEGGLILVGNHNGFSGSWDGMQQGDDIVVETTYGRFHYRITTREIIDGGDDAVVQNLVTSGETLVVTTCWPLWQGAFAHQRLVFIATPVVKT
jgi:LPXTG-site transpeptidase (sortase) family protein